MKRCSLFAVCLFLAVGLWGSVQVTDLEIKGRWPWNGKVDISYSVQCDELDDQGRPANVYVGFTGYDDDLRQDVPMLTLEGDGVDGPVTAGGPYTVVWDAAADNGNFHSSSFSVKARATVGEGDFIVVDISNGPDAETYPWRYSNNGPRLNGQAWCTTELWLRRVKAGMFTMGVPEDETGRIMGRDMACHDVTLTQDFFIGLCECTQKQWELVMGTTPAQMKGDLRPVENVTYDAVRGVGWPEQGHYALDSTFMGRLQQKTDLVFDLPTEAQWERACRMAANGDCLESALTNGENLTGTAVCAHLDGLGRYAGNAADGKGGFAEHTAAAQYAPSGLGLFDVHGNVAEWCLDWLGASVTATAPATDPAGMETGTARLVRGGSWSDEAAGCRAGARGSAAPDTAVAEIGFRAAVMPQALMTYKLTINLIPNAGNTWSIDGVDHESGETVLLKEGEYKVSFSAARGYVTPEDMTVTVDKTKTVDVNYAHEYSLSYTFDVSGARWTVNGKEHASGDVVKLQEGEYEVSFKNGRPYTPAPQQVKLDKDMNITLSCKHPMYLYIDISGGKSATKFPIGYSVTGPDLTKDACRTTQIWLRLVPNGSYIMGSPKDELGRSNGRDFTQHSVTLTKMFYIGVFEITQKQWELVMGRASSSMYKGDTRPVECVSYESIRGHFDDEKGWPQDGYEVSETSFMGVLRKKTGLRLDLPTEAQWEYANRMRIDGSCVATALNSGENLTGTSACEKLGRLGRYARNAGDGKGGFAEHTVVGSYEPNEIGLYDMHGNVFEWCLDWFVEDIGSTTAVTDPKGGYSALDRVMRGGSWKADARNCRSAYRSHERQDGDGDKDGLLGFRLGYFPEEAIGK